MKKWILAGLTALLLTGCSFQENGQQRAQTGRIGTDTAITREMAAKTIALAFYSPQELTDLETKADFSDLSVEDWAYPYIAGCVEQGFFSGSEEGTFCPQDDLTLWEAQTLMDRLAPDYDSRIVLTDENKNMAVSYDLWVQLLETALKARRGEDSLYSYGLEAENAVLLSKDGLCDTGKFMAAGLDLQSYEFSRITFWEKDGEIVALLTVEALSPVVRNIYCYKEEGQFVLDTGDGTAAFSYKGDVEDGIADVKLENGKVTEVNFVEKLGRCTVKRVNGEEIYLAEKGAVSWAEDARVYDARGEAAQGNFSDLICGTDAAEYYEKDGQICGAVIFEDAVPENMRVFLKGAEQEKVTVSAEQGFTLSNVNGKKEFPAGARATLTADLPWFNYGILTVKGKDCCPVQIDFADGTSYTYEGVLELERRGENSFSVINELPMERYLLGVVPHEMPASFGQTALEAQAITARSYAYNQFYGNTYCGYGAHVMDTVASQVYLGYEKNEVAEAAVQATAGMCAVTNDKVAQTYFYSTSCGFGAGSEEVWSADGTFSGEGKAYLQAQPYGDFATPKTEEAWLAFWQNWEREGYDMDSPWYCWKVYFGCGQLSEILMKTLQEVKKNKPASILVEEGNIADLGKLQSMEVTRRGKGGVVMELQMTFEKSTVKVRTENAVRKVLSPTKLTIGEPIYLQRKSGDSLTGNSMLPSGFFAVKEMRNGEGTLTGIALYGGGNGHGVGMSQYGAKKLAEQGKTAAEIIADYFPGTTVEKVL